MKIIPKFQNPSGPLSWNKFNLSLDDPYDEFYGRVKKNWYDNIQDYTGEYNLRWNPNSGYYNPITRENHIFAPNKGNSSTTYGYNKNLHESYVKDVLEQDSWYKDNTKAFFNEDKSLTKLGENFKNYILQDNNVAQNIKSILNSKDNQAIYDTINRLRNDGKFSRFHGVNGKIGDRYYYKDEQGAKHYINPNDVDKYIVSTDFESIEDPTDKRITWNDYEVLGLSGLPDNTTQFSPREQVMEDIMQQNDNRGISEDIDQINNSSDPLRVVTKSDIKGSNKEGKSNWLSKLKGSNELNPFLLGGMRVLADNLANTRNTEEYISHLNAPLQNPEQFHRQIHGDYIAKQNAEAQAARLRSAASQPFTADADKQMAYQLEAIDKGNQAILAGQQRDAQEFYRTSEVAANQEKENIHNRVTTANTNRQLLSQYDEMRARLRFNNKTQNMQNWDRWWSTFEDRALAKYDYNQKRQQDMQETMDDLATSIGIDTTEYDGLVAQYYDAKTEAERQKILAQIKSAGKKIQLQKYYNLGNYKGVTWNKEWTDLFKKEGIIPSVKNGGVLRKMQQGGGFPLVQWTPLMGSPYQQYLALLMSGKEGTSSKSSSKSSSSSSSDKQEASLAKSIIETLKGGDLLQSDMDVIAAQMAKFFDLQQYAPEEMDENMLYRGYISMLSQVNKAKQSASNFKQAYDNASKNGGLHEAAINEQGLVYVGQKGTDKLSVVTPEQYFENQDKYILLTNQDLLYLRQNHPSQAFNDTNILSAASNGVGMDQVSKFVKEIVGTLGHDKNSRDQLVYNFGEQAAQGIKVLEDLKSKGFTTEETNAVMSGGLKALWELNTVTQDQYKQASQAIGAVWQSLPANMRSLLTLRTGSKEGAVDLISKMILSGTTYESSFKVSDTTPLDESGNLKSSTKTGTGGSGDDKMKLTAASNLALGYGKPTKFVITPNGKDSSTGWHVSGNSLPITDSSDKNLGDTTMDELTRAFGGMLDLSHAYMGNSRISSLGTGQVWIHTGEITQVALPKDPNVNYNKPHFERFRLVSEADDILEKEGINSSKVAELTLDQKKRVNEVYQSKGLAPKYDQKGNLNQIAYAYFGLVKGTASEKAFEQDVTFDHDFMFPATDVERSNFEQHMKKANSDFSISDRWEIGPVKWGDQVFTGTIFIPLNTDLISTQSGYGSAYAGSPSQNMTLDALQQQKDAIKEQGRPPLDIIKRNFNEQ